MAPPSGAPAYKSRSAWKKRSVGKGLITEFLKPAGTTKDQPVTLGTSVPKL